MYKYDSTDTLERMLNCFKTPGDILNIWMYQQGRYYDTCGMVTLIEDLGDSIVVLRGENLKSTDYYVINKSLQDYVTSKYNWYKRSNGTYSFGRNGTNPNLPKFKFPTIKVTPERLQVIDHRLHVNCVHVTVNNNIWFYSKRENGVFSFPSMDIKTIKVTGAEYVFEEKTINLHYDTK